jgi:hypothetical protein
MRLVFFRVFFVFWPEALFLSAPFVADFFFADFWGRFAAFIEIDFLAALLLGFVDFFLAFFLVAIGAV